MLFLDQNKLEILKDDYKKILFLVAVFFWGCGQNTSMEMSDSADSYVETMLSFIRIEEYDISLFKSDIPERIIDSLEIKEIFLGDISDIDEICLGSWIYGICQYNCMLFFSLINEQTVLLCYKKGGCMGSYNVIEYYSTLGAKTHQHYETFEDISDIESLTNALEKISNEE